jgi:alkanesulfonate monooxygenase SsuD/methylene tetrahydromethanopterin reductase-like flavin-dependent oxidoreductase (luciferase family)
MYGPRGLDLTGKVADGWSPSLPYAPLERAVELRERVLSAAEAEGRPRDAVVCNLNFGIRVGGHARDERVVVGTSEEVADRMLDFVRAGFTSLSLWPLGEDAEQVERIAREVVPQVRNGAAALDAAQR